MCISSDPVEYLGPKTKRDILRSHGLAHATSELSLRRPKWATRGQIAPRQRRWPAPFSCPFLYFTTESNELKIHVSLVQWSLSRVALGVSTRHNLTGAARKIALSLHRR